MTKRRKKKQKRSLSDKGDNSSGNSSSDQSLTAISNKGKCTTNKENKKVFLSNTISEALSCINNNSPTSTNDQIVNMNHSINPGFQYTTPMQSSTPVSYQQYQQYQPYPQPPTPPPPPHPVSPGIESLLKEMCNRLAGVESKLTKLDSIEERTNSQFKHFDSELVSCKDRIGVLEHSAQFLSNIHDEHKSLKLRLETVAKNIETTKTVNKDVKDRLIDVETQSLRQNLLFFAIDEQPDNTDMETNRPGDDMGGVTGGETGIRGVQREIHDGNCSNIVLEFCENVMKIENAKTNIKIEKAYRLGRKKDGATRPRPIVVKFGSYVEREMVRNLSKRLKGTNFGISPHYPPEVLEKRKKLIPVMLKERQENKKAYIVGDKLFVNGTLWKE